jgi:hypothetical protein
MIVTMPVDSRFPARRFPAPALAATLLAAALGGCAAPEPTGPAASATAASGTPMAGSTDSGPSATDTAASTASAPGGSQVAQAVTAPLADLNIVRAEIPSVLASALKAPYALPEDGGCASLAAQVRALDAALGADLDTPPTTGDPGLVERGTGAVGDAAVGAIRGAAEGVVPFRGWVRRLTGAERYAKEVAAAIAAGTIRRAFLKGLGHAAGCAAPAAPRRPGAAEAAAPSR